MPFLCYHCTSLFSYWWRSINIWLKSTTGFVLHNSKCIPGNNKRTQKEENPKNWLKYDQTNRIVLHWKIWKLYIIRLHKSTEIALRNPSKLKHFKHVESILSAWLPAEPAQLWTTLHQQLQFWKEQINFLLIESTPINRNDSALCCSFEILSLDIRGYTLGTCSPFSYFVYF